MGWLMMLAAWSVAGAPPADLAPLFEPPAAFRDDLGSYRSPLLFDDGRPVRSADDWRKRRGEILRYWHEVMGPWPPMLDMPRLEVLATAPCDGGMRHRVRLPIAPGWTTEGYLLVPHGKGPFPAMIVVFYEPETAVGLSGKPNRDFAAQFVRHGIVALSIGADPFASYYPSKEQAQLQPLSFHAYTASNALNALSAWPTVDAARIGIMGHSYGGKWAMFAACLNERFACGVWSDPGVAFDESRSNVNYWEPWYLGWEAGRMRPRGLVTKENPRTGAYARLMNDGRDLHEVQALMAPRPFLVSGGAEDQPERWRALNHARAVNRLLGHDDRVAMSFRDGHDPTPESNRQIVRFLVETLKPPRTENAAAGSAQPGVNVAE